MENVTSPINENATLNNVQVQEYLQHLKDRKSINLYRLSRRGLALFFQFLPQDPSQVIKDAQKRSKSENFNERNYYGFAIERFYKWLMTDQKDRPAFGHNSARVYCGAVESFFTFYNVSNLEISGDLHKVVSGLRCYVPTVTDFRKMYAVGDLKGKVVLSLGLDLAWRPEDFLEVRKDGIDLNATEPQPTDRITQKELEPGYSFISMETLELLRLYIPTLPKDNPYLFPNGNGGHITEETLNNILKRLVEKAQINTGKKVFTFVGFRKRLLSQAIDVHIDPNAAKLITGKAVPPEMKTYINSADFKAQFIKLRDSMRLSETIAPSNHAKMEELAEQVKKLSEKVGDQSMEIRGLQDSHKAMIDLVDTIAERQSEPLKTDLKKAIKVVREKAKRKTA